MMDYLADAFDHIDYKKSGLFVAWELKDYLINET